MMTFLQLVYAEGRCELYRMRTYYVEFVAAQLFFVLGFLMLSGLFHLLSEGHYGDQARLVSLIGFLTWQVADGCMIRTARSFAEDAQWGTLEQVWLGVLSPTATIIARSFVVLAFNVIKALMNGLVLVLLFGLVPNLSPAMLIVFLLTQIGVFGLTFIIIGFHLVYQRVESITFVLSTSLLFVTGALAPLDGAPILSLIGQLLPLGLGVRLLQEMALQTVSVTILLTQPAFYALVMHTLLYMVAGGLIFAWGEKRARLSGSLGHY
jgi:ABC-2 type transport system permease protein